MIKVHQLNLNSILSISSISTYFYIFDWIELNLLKQHGINLQNQYREQYCKIFRVNMKYFIY
jgi:hypothetical protein